MNGLPRSRESKEESELGLNGEGGDFRPNAKTCMISLLQLTAIILALV